MTARDRLLNAGYREVLLPSGSKVRGVMPILQDLIRRGVVSHELRVAVFAAEKAHADGKPLTREQEMHVAEEQRIEAAAFARHIWDDEAKAWEPLVLTAADLNDGGMDPFDVDALEDIVLYRRTPEQITAATLAKLGEISTAEAERVDREEAGDTVDGFREFRGDGGSDAPGSDGEDVHQPAVDDARPPAAPRRPRARRGAGPSAAAL